MYFSPINEMLAEYMIFDEAGRVKDLNPPINLSKKEKNLLMSYLWKIEGNRRFTLNNYLLVEEKIRHLIDHIEENVDN